MCDVSQLVSQPLFILGDSLRYTMLLCGETPVLVGTQVCTVVSDAVTKWFSSTRLETRTKESSTCASSQVASLLAQ